MANAALLAVLLALNPQPTLPPAPPSCVLLLQAAGVAGQKVTPQNVGKLFGAALELRVERHKGTTLQNMFTKADINGAADDLTYCFQLKDH